MDRIWSSFENLQRKIVGSAASSSQTAYERVANPVFKQINESLYEVHAPEGCPAVEIIFFHGLQLDGSRDGQFSTWLSGDGSQIWLNWIAEDIPDALILTVSYNVPLSRTAQSGRMDVYITAENLLQELISGHIGQSGCPVVLVGHSLGGIVIKQLCVCADTKSYGVRGMTLKQNFLNNLKGFFFYACPHYGSKIADLSRGELFEPVTILNREAAGVNEEFRRLRMKYKLKAFGIGESLAVTLGSFTGVIVEEASARLDVDYFYVADGDHFTVCRPDSQMSRSYRLLVNFVLDILQEARAQRVPKLNFPKAPGPKTDFPDEVIGLERQTMAVIEKLDVTQRLCLVGVQGIGKTTLVEAVYDKIKERFDYTCFLGEASKYLAFEEHPDDLRAKIKRSLCFGGLGGNVPNNFKWSTLQGRNVLIVLDDVVSESQVLEMTESDDFSDESRIIVTTKDAGYLNTKTLYCHSVEKLDQNDSLRLFCLHAFQMANLPHEYENYKDLIIKITEYCGGLPQILKMTGRYFHSKRKVGFEPETEIGMHEIGMHGIRMYEVLQDLQRETKDSEGNTGHPRPENVSTQSKEFYHSAQPTRPYDQAPQDAENAVARSREDAEQRIDLDQEDAGKSTVWAQEGSKNPAIMDEDHDAMANKKMFVAEEGAKIFNVTDKDCESNSIVETTNNHLEHGKQQDFVKDFIREINRGESGYFVSKEWLFSLEEHDKETVMSVLRRAGYFDFHQTGTTIIYGRIEDSGSRIETSDFLDSEMANVSSIENKLAMVQIDETSRLGSPRSLPDQGKTILSSSNETLQSFKTALKDIRPFGYFVSTQWLSTLTDHEVEDLNIVLCKAGYSQIDKTSTTTTYFKRPHNHVQSNPEHQSESPSASERTLVGDTDTSSTYQDTEVFRAEKLQGSDDTEVASKTQERQRRQVDCTCLPQYLTVSCTPPCQSPVEASTSSSQRSIQHSTRQRVSDCHVTLPRPRKQQYMITGADKVIEMTTIDFHGKKPYLKTVSLDVSADTSLSCCLTSDQNDKKVRFGFHKIEGAVKMAQSMNQITIPLVLIALRTNVYAYTTKAEQTEGSEPVRLRILKEYKDWRGEPERYQSIDGNGQTRRFVRMEISAKHPKNSQRGSETLELQYLDRFCTTSDLKYGSYELMFSDHHGPSVVFQGVVPANLDQNSSLKLDVRYQLEICHFEGCDSFPREQPFVGFLTAITKVDFDCVLEFSCKLT